MLTTNFFFFFFNVTNQFNLEIVGGHANSWIDDFALISSIELKGDLDYSTLGKEGMNYITLKF